jgi:hypothetical protein
MLYQAAADKDSSDMGQAPAPLSDAQQRVREQRERELETMRRR